MLEKMLKVGLGALLALLVATQLLAGAKGSGAKAHPAQKKEFVVKVEKSNEVVRITVTGKLGYQCNTLYPWKLTVEGLVDGEKVYKKSDAKQFSKEAVVFEVPYIKGQMARMKISMCNDTQCIMHEEKLSW